MADIFKCKEAMPLKTNSGDVARTAQTASEMRADYTPALLSSPKMATESVERPRFGHGY